MVRALLVTAAAAAAVVSLGLITCTVASPWRRELANKRLDESVDVDVAGVATVALPPTFHPVGIVNTGERRWFGGGTTSLENHLDERRLTFRFEQGQHTAIGGRKVDPVLLDVTLFNRSVPDAAVAQITSTTIDRFYPPVDDEPRLAAHFAAQRWLPDEGGTRVAATNEGRGDDLVSAPPERWLAIHVDPARRVRVDLHAWRSAYTRDEAVALVRRVAAGVTASPALQAHFDGIATFDERMAERHARTIAAAAARLRACGLTGLTPGAVAFGERCAAHLTESRRDLRVARVLGTVPLRAAVLAAREPPRFPGEAGRDVAMIYWDAATGGWAVEGLRSSIYEDEDRDNALTAALAARLTDRAAVQLVRLVKWDLRFHPDRVDVDGFLAESARAEAALRAGTLIPGVPAAP